jgi:hypothetical protein
MDFEQAKKRFKQLKNQFESGTLSESEFKTQLEELMVQDGVGNWWMIGYETEQWYRNDGTDWVQADPPAIRLQKPINISNRVALSWIALGFAIGWAIGGASIALISDLPVFLAIAWVIGWAIGGFVTATTLKSERALTKSKSVLWITLGWAIAFLIALTIVLVINLPISLAAFGATVGLLGGGIGGFITGIILRNENVISNQKSMVWTTLAWSIGGLLGGAAGLAIGPAIGGSIGDLVGLPIVLGISGAIHGGIGGLVTIWQIKKR